MISIRLRSVLQQLGSASPIVLGAAYAFCAIAMGAVEARIPGNVLGSTVGMIFFAILIGFLFVTVTWFRDDDWLAAGVLMTLIVYATNASLLLLAVMFHGGIGPAALFGALGTGGAIITAIIFAPIAGGLVALARWLSRAPDHQPLGDSR